MERNSNIGLISGLVLVVVLIGLFLLLAPFTIVETGEKAVVLHWGEYSRTLEPGLHYVNSIAESVNTMNVTTMKEEVTASAASKDLQSVSARIAVNYTLDPSKVSEIWAQFKGEQKAVVIDPSVQESVKAATAKYTAEELITKRELVRSDILEALKAHLAPSNIMVSNVSIVDFDFSPGFNASIEAKVKAVQDALAAENKLKQIQFEAQQTVATAQAQAQAIRLASDAANNEKYVELERLKVEMQWAKNWKGDVPTSIYGSAPIPFIPVPNAK